MKLSGPCSLCDKIYSKNYFTRHILSCTKKISGDKKGYIVCVRDRVFWLYMYLPKNIYLSDLDKYIRDIWTECCDHVSLFIINKKIYSSAKNWEENLPFEPKYRAFYNSNESNEYSESSGHNDEPSGSSGSSEICDSGELCESSSDLDVTSKESILSGHESNESNESSESNNAENKNGSTTASASENSDASGSSDDSDNYDVSNMSEKTIHLLVYKPDFDMTARIDGLFEIDAILEYKYGSKTHLNIEVISECSTDYENITLLGRNSMPPFCCQICSTDVNTYLCDNCHVVLCRDCSRVQKYHKCINEDNCKEYDNPVYFLQNNLIKLNINSPRIGISCFSGL
jgi:hypothetical protein